MTHPLVPVIQDLSRARDLPTVQAIVRRAARELSGADGATFVLRDGDKCFYADEDAIAPLWKGQRFPLEACVSGWAMTHRQPVVIGDIYADDRVPAEAYRPTFVKSLVMVPIRSDDPIGAIGTYWARKRLAAAEKVEVLQALADSTAIAMEHVRILSELERLVTDRTGQLLARTEEAEQLTELLRSEVAERTRAEEEVRRLSLTDELTGLLNRRGLLVHAERARKLPQRRGVACVLLFVDVDGLKAVNDGLGHDAGDRLLRRAAAAIDGALREVDVVGRWGGDEFVAFLPDTDDPTEPVARIRHAAATADVPVQLSVGASVVDPADGRSFERLVIEADEAMYQQKRARRLTAPASSVA
ncbi:MAG TPA: diguanylate cyclase [Acidimicrobiales bacterium]|nr:diguanylate cyclase [Acidimicrobiales bacterium]